MTTRTLRLILFGSTGSIGCQTLSVLDHLRATGWNVELAAITAGHDSERFRAQIRQQNPECIGVAVQEDGRHLCAAFPDLPVHAGADALAELASRKDVDLVFNAIVGAAGLPITWAALRRGHRLALANKESLAIAGQTLRSLLSEHHGEILSIDSEHHALHQCLEGRSIEDVSRLLITASGGPFRGKSADVLWEATPEQALAHPTWTMGKRITVDSATLVNKAFEVIGAHTLYGVGYDKIQVLIHPQSLVHSMVEFADGSTLAELGPRDMRIPIQHALIHPERLSSGLQPLCWENGISLAFEPLQAGQFPAFETVLSAAKAGEGALAAVNAADEVLIDRFLAQEIRFPEIALGLQAILDHWRSEAHKTDVPATLTALLAADDWGRHLAMSMDLQS